MAFIRFPDFRRTLLTLCASWLVAGPGSRALAEQFPELAGDSSPQSVYIAGSLIRNTSDVWPFLLIGSLTEIENGSPAFFDVNNNLIPNVGATINFYPDKFDSNTGYLLTTQALFKNTNLSGNGPWQLILSPVIWNKIHPYPTTYLFKFIDLRLSDTTPGLVTVAAQDTKIQNPPPGKTFLSPYNAYVATSLNGGANWNVVWVHDQNSQCPTPQTSFCDPGLEYTEDYLKPGGWLGDGYTVALEIGPNTSQIFLDRDALQRGLFPAKLSYRSDDRGATFPSDQAGTDFEFALPGPFGGALVHTFGIPNPSGVDFYQSGGAPNLAFSTDGGKTYTFPAAIQNQFDNPNLLFMLGGSNTDLFGTETHGPGTQNRTFFYHTTDQFATSGNLTKKDVSSPNLHGTGPFYPFHAFSTANGEVLYGGSADASGPCQDTIYLTKDWGTSWNDASGNLVSVLENHGANPDKPCFAQAIAAVRPAPLTGISVQLTGPGQGSVTSDIGGISCNPTCATFLDPGQKITLTPAPQTGYVFSGWQNCTPANGAQVVGSTCVATAGTVSETFLASFDTTSKLTVSKTGSGTVTDPSGAIDCGTACSALFPTGSTVVLTANPTSGSALKTWTGCNAGSSGNQCSVLMSAAEAVRATFAPIFAVTVSEPGDGVGSVKSSSPGIDGQKINCGNGGSDCAENYFTGTSLTLTAAPATGSVFSGWSGACSGTSTTCSLSVTAAKNAVATFKKLYSLTVTKTGLGTGTVTSSPSGINCGSACSHSYVSGTLVTLTATASTGSSFNQWVGCPNPSGTTCKLTLSSPVTVTADFKKP